MENSVLVSIIVVTYNSKKTIIETLDSIKAQTYQNIELIISDDCSTDDTVAICKKWKEENYNRFERIVIIESPVNTGVAENGNRGKKEAQGVWTKGIAGDDLLLPNCVEDNIAFANSHPDANVIFSDLRRFANDDKSKLIEQPFDKTFFDLDAEGQYNWLIQYNNPPALTLFSKKSFMENFPNDKRYPFMEDYPKWFHITQSGEKLYFFDKVTALYRVGESLSHSQKFFYNTKYMDSAYDFFVNERAALMKEKGYKEAYKNYSNAFKLYHLTLKLGINEVTWFHRLIYRMLYAVVYQK